MSNPFSLSKLARLFRVGNGSTVSGVDPSGNPIALPYSQPNDLTNILFPSIDGGWRDTYRAGWLPAWFNQQWGGAQWGGLPDGSNGDVATGNIEDNLAYAFGTTSGADLYHANKFRVSETQIPLGAFIKIYKAGNPTDNVTVQIYSNNAGVPGTAMGMAGNLPAKTITSKTDGEWYYVPFTTTQLVAGTDYWIVLSRSSGVGSSTDFFRWKGVSTTKYPFGTMYHAGALPTWMAVSISCMCFLIPNSAANAFLQAGGQFDAKYTFNQGNPVNQSKMLCQPMKNFFNGKNFTALIRGSGYSASLPITDFAYGLDHERLQISTNATGNVVVTFYPESDAIAPTVITGTQVVTGAGLKDISVVGRFVGDGADFLKLVVNGVVDGTPVTNQTWAMSNDWRDLGTATLGGGFRDPVSGNPAPTWTVNTNATALAGLPSLAGWTWTGTAVEANAFSVSGGKAYQNANGYVTTNNGYYTRATTLNNATGWSVEWKGRIVSANNGIAPTSAGIAITIGDGVRMLNVYIQEYFIQTGQPASGADFTYQADFRSQEHVIVFSGQGTNYYVHIDGKLVIDGTGKFLFANAVNVMQFGNMTGTPSDAIYSYIKIYNGGMLLPTAHTGASISEFAYWSGDKSALLPLAYNAGTPISIKQLCGVERNYVGEGAVFSEVRRGITSTSSFAINTNVLSPEMETFIIGESFEIESQGQVSHSATSTNSQELHNLNGKQLPLYGLVSNSNMNYVMAIPAKNRANSPVGLAKIEVRQISAGGSGSASNMVTDRNMLVTAKP